MMSAKYFEYYTIILRGAVFSWTHCIYFDFLISIFSTTSTYIQYSHRQQELQVHLALLFDVTTVSESCTQAVEKLQ